MARFKVGDVLAATWGSPLSGAYPDSWKVYPHPGARLIVVAVDEHEMTTMGGTWPVAEYVLYEPREKIYHHIKFEGQIPEVVTPVATALVEVNSMKAAIIG